MRRPYTKTTTERGLGWEHQKQRARLLPRAIGTRCPIGLRGCDGVMVDPKRMELDHTIPRALGGRMGDRIVCRHCNRSRGASMGNRMRGKAGSRRAGGQAGSQPAAPIRSRQW